METAVEFLAFFIGLRVLIAGFPNIKIGCTEVNHYYNDNDNDNDEESEEEDN